MCLGKEFMPNEYLNPDNAFIWRIVRLSDMGWLLEDGLDCKNSIPAHRNYQSMGSNSLIDRRGETYVDIGNQGSLNDYVPFYFTPFSIMMLNIHTGYGDIPQIDNSDIVILVASLHDLVANNIDFVFTDRHAYVEYANFRTDLQYLRDIDWTILQNRDFSYSPNDPDKKVRYQAEALIYKNLPIAYLKAIVCYNETAKAEIESHLNRFGISANVHVSPKLYF